MHLDTNKLDKLYISPYRLINMAKAKSTGKRKKKAAAPKAKAIPQKKLSIWFWLFAILGLGGSILFVIIAWILYGDRRHDKKLDLPKAIIYWDTAMMIIRIVVLAFLMGGGLSIF